MGLRVIGRMLALDQQTARILLVRNQGADFWYAPGGGWDYESETIESCVIRETREETGVEVYPVRLLYVQEFRPGNGDTHIELFWFGYPTSSTDLIHSGDLHGIVEEARWFTRNELTSLNVYPRRLREQFWNELASVLTSPSLMIK